MKNIIVLGGGTAGLISAITIKQTFPNYSVKVIESDSVGIIGVGEGSTEHWRRWSEYCKIDICELVRETDGALKKGIKFENWNGDGKSYFHSLSHPFYAYNQAVNSNAFVKTLIIDNIKTEDVLLETSLVDYAGGLFTVNQYHFNTFKLNAYLHKLCSERKIDVITSTIVLNTATTANGGGTTANSLSFITRVYIQGDGTGLQASANLSSNGVVSKVTIDVTGTGYSYANATIYGSGTGANTRVVIPPKFGHGFNPAKELDATNVMVSERIGSVDSTENGLISATTSFRQYGLLRDPYKYGNTSPVISSNANTVISQTTNLTLIAGTDFELNEFVYQGVSANNAYFYGFVNSQSSNEVRLTKVRGTVSVGGLLIGANSGITRTVVKKFNPEFQPYTGDILYVENTQKIQRADGQAENVKFVIRF